MGVQRGYPPLAHRFSGRESLVCKNLTNEGPTFDIVDTMDQEIHRVCVRPAYVRSMGDLTRAQAHATRTGKSGQESRRDDLSDSHPVALAWCYADGKEWHQPKPTITVNADGSDESVPPVAPEPGLRLIESYEKFLADNGNPQPWKGGRWAFHLLVIVPPAWFSGDPHDPDDPEVRRFFGEAIRWAESELGGVWAARYDVDELGSGVVDIFASPILEVRNRRRIMPTKAEKLLADRLAKESGRKASKTWSALQTSWALWAQNHLDPALRRGQPVGETLAEHLRPSEFRKRVAAVEAREKEVVERENAIQCWWAHFRAEVAEQNRKLRDLVRRLLRYGSQLEKKVLRLEDENRRQKDLIEGLAQTIGRGAAAEDRCVAEPVTTTLRAGLAELSLTDSELKLIDHNICVGRENYHDGHPTGEITQEQVWAAENDATEAQMHAELDALYFPDIPVSYERAEAVERRAVELREMWSKAS